MWQAGVVGSVAFFCAMTHNEFLSIRNPFTKPSSRLLRYHCVCWCELPLMIPSIHTALKSVVPFQPDSLSRFTCHRAACSRRAFVAILSSPYISPENTAFTGYGYRYSYIMCWSPNRDFNLQVAPDCAVCMSSSFLSNIQSLPPPSLLYMLYTRIQTLKRGMS